MYTNNTILNERLDWQKTIEAAKSANIELKKQEELKRKLENLKSDDINTKYFGLAIQQAINKSNINPYIMGKSIINQLLNAKTSDEFDAISCTIKTLTGCSVNEFVKTLIDYQKKIDKIMKKLDTIFERKDNTYPE